MCNSLDMSGERESNCLVGKDKINVSCWKHCQVALSKWAKANKFRPLETLLMCKWGEMFNSLDLSGERESNHPGKDKINVSRWRHF